jgi:tetratricopeptide (TPR) repeat protein
LAVQVVRGNHNVQIQDVHGSSIQIRYESRVREVPLEPAVVPVSARVRSPARLVRARSGVVPYSAREGLLDGLEDWLDARDPFATCVIGGRGGCGKTRLGVELCERAKTRNWLCGLLSRIVDPAALEEFAVVPTARLVVVDYAESRADQLEVLLPLLRGRATAENPVRVLLLVRACPRRTEDWTEALQGRSDWLDTVLDECEVRVLEDMPLESNEREALFRAAAAVFAGRVDPPVAPPSPPDGLGGEIFSSPLLVVIAAYLAVHGDTPLPSTKTKLLDELLKHEQRYWRANAANLFSNDVLPRRVVGLATLADTENETTAARLLRLLPDLVDADAERCGSLARWVHELYPGARWWNPLEPDLLGEHLVADTFTDQPEVLAGVLAGEDSEGIVQPLDILARAASDHPQLAAALQPILSRELGRLCKVAVAQAATTTDRDLIYSNTTTAAAAINRAIIAIKVDPSELPVVLDQMPQRPDLILSPLAVTLTSEQVEHLRPLAAASPTAYEPDLARSLNNHSTRLAETGRRGESFTVIEEAVEIYRRLVAANPAAYEPDLARSLNNLSLRMGEARREGEALTASEEAVEIYRRLVAANPAAYEHDLAHSLNNLSNRLRKAKRNGEALTAIEEAVEIRRRLVAANPAAYEPDLARSLNNLSLRLGTAGRRGEALTAIEEAVEIRRRLVAANPAAYEPDLAVVLSNFSLRLAEVRRDGEALTAIEEVVEIRRRLVDTNPAVYEPDLAYSLHNLSLRLGTAERRGEGFTVIEEAVEIYRRLVAANPAAYEPDLAGSLHNLSGDLAEAGRRGEALTAIEEAVEIYRRLVAANPAYEPDLAGSLNDLSLRLAEAGRSGEGLIVIEEAVEIYRRLVAANPTVYEPDLTRSLNNLSLRLAEVGREGEGLIVIEEAVEIYRRLVAANPAVYEPDFAHSLNNLSNRLAEAGLSGEALTAIEEAVEIRRRLVAANPAAYEPDLARSLHNLSLRLLEVGRHADAESARRELADLSVSSQSSSPSSKPSRAEYGTTSERARTSRAGDRTRALTGTTAGSNGTSRTRLSYLIWIDEP